VNSKDNSVVSQHISEPVSEALLIFQEQNSGFKELFVTDMKGLNVGETNKTSDFLQADEAWWVGAFALGSGHAYWGDVEYDESARSESIPLYVPVMDASASRAIGVLKAVYDINAAKLEL
jgi:hypothetical protein